MKDENVERDWKKEWEAAIKFQEKDRETRFLELQDLCKLKDIQWTPVEEEFFLPSPWQLMLGIGEGTYGKIIALGLQIMPEDPVYPLVFARASIDRLEMIPALIASGALALSGRAPVLYKIHDPMGTKGLRPDSTYLGGEVIDPEEALAEAHLINLPDVAVDLDEE